MTAIPPVVTCPSLDSIAVIVSTRTLVTHKMPILQIYSIKLTFFFSSQWDAGRGSPGQTQQAAPLPPQCQHLEARHTGETLTHTASVSANVKEGAWD